MAIFLKLIEENKVQDLSLRVFDQKLSPQSTGVFTDVLNEAEENAVAQKLLTCDTESSNSWKAFIMRYFEHYFPFNSTVDILLQHTQNEAVRDILMPIAEKSGLRIYQAEKLCKIVHNEQFSHCFCLLEAYCRNTRAMYFDNGFYLSLLNIDDKYADCDDINVKLAELYKTKIDANTKTSV